MQPGQVSTSPLKCTQSAKTRVKTNSEELGSIPGVIRSQGCCGFLSSARASQEIGTSRQFGWSMLHLSSKCLFMGRHGHATWQLT